MKFEICVLVCGLVALIALVSGAAGRSDDLEQQRALYCEMAETFKNTGGEYGWPDYKDTYGRDCR